MGSRRSCETLIEEGKVSVNGERIVHPATTVDQENDIVCVEGRRVTPNRAAYLMVNKPPGFTCSAKDRHADRLVFELIPERYGRLFTIGRLDRDSEGLLLLTNDGDFAQRLGHPSGGVRKTYDVWVSGNVNGSILSRLRTG
ncbi:MAG: pseudouridine synthase, partial [bacterium]